MTESDRFNPRRDKPDRVVICPYMKHPGSRGYEPLRCGIHPNKQSMADNDFRCRMCLKAGGPKVHRTYGQRSQTYSVPGEGMNSRKGLDNTPKWYKDALRNRRWDDFKVKPQDVLKKVMGRKVI